MVPAGGRSVPLYGFCQATRQWTALASLAPSNTSTGTVSQPAVADGDAPIASTSKLVDPPSSLTCLTYNVFSGPSSSSIPHLQHRIKAALRILQTSGADVLALQEVSSTFERALRRERWLRQGFAVTSLRDYFLALTGGTKADQSARGEDDGCLLAVKTALLDSVHEADMLRLPGEQGKVLISLRTPSGLGFATSHFESLSTSTSIRTKQYTMAASALTESNGTAILLGDFNHASHAELLPLLRSSRHLKQPFVDQSAPRHPSQQMNKHAPPPDLLRDQPTFGELYPYFDARRRDRRKPRRIDVILSSCPRDSLTVTNTWTEGGQPVTLEKKPKPPKGNENAPVQTQGKVRRVKLKCQEGKGGHLYASDHLAVIVQFALSNVAQ